MTSLISLHVIEFRSAEIGVETDPKPPALSLMGPSPTNRSFTTMREIADQVSLE